MFIPVAGSFLVWREWHERQQETLRDWRRGVFPSRQDRRRRSPA